MNYSDTLNNLLNSIKDTQIESSDSRFRSDYFYFYLNRNNTNDCAVGISLEERKAKIGIF